MSEQMDFGDGKYTVIYDNGSLKALRYGEPWKRDLTGDNLIYWMLVEAIRLKEERDALAAKLREQEGQEPVNTRLVEALKNTIDLLWVEDSHSVEFDGTVKFGQYYDFSGVDGTSRTEFLWPGFDCIVWPSAGRKWSAYCTHEGSMWFEKFDTKGQAKEQCLRLLDQVMPDHPVSKARSAIVAAESQQATWGKGFALVPKRLTRAMNDLLSEEGWEWADLLAAAEAITEEEYAALVADENTEPVRLTRESVARAIWGVRREYEDRCDMELEDMGESHPVWDEADAVLAAAELTQTDPTWLTIEQARNAERYAYLRSQHEGSVAASFAVFAPEQPIGEFGPVGSMPGELDAAIDSAMRADSHKVEG